MATSPRIARSLAAIAALALLVSCDQQPAPPGPAAVDPAHEARFRAGLDYVLGGELEAGWQQVPWRPRVWEGVLDAQRADKPVLLWLMNGHPLGFT